MADNIPIEIQVEIIKHLPVKSLIRCTLLSKLFNSIIKSSSFVTEHSFRHNHQHHLLARYETVSDDNELQQNHVSIIDNDNFPKNKCPITVPETFKGYESGQSWVLIPKVVGFGVCNGSSDPKLVRIGRYGNRFTSNSVNWDAEIYTASSGVWRTVPSDKPRKSVTLENVHETINGIIYWLARDYSSETGNELDKQMIITFDLTSEKIGEVYLPNSLAHPFTDLYLSKRMESLAVISDYYEEGNQQVCDVWIMKHAVLNSFEKIYTFKAPKGSSDRVIGFRKNGEPILLRLAPSKGDRFEVYNPSSHQFSDLEVSGNHDIVEVVTVSSFKETLLLIDQPNTILINDDTKVDVADNDGNDNDDAATAASVLMDMHRGLKLKHSIFMIILQYPYMKQLFLRSSVDVRIATFW
ncbi:putative F-box protein At1g30920 [Rutidosis leptorrhynchoides]|uniref:putative F-box protein At1g30920 n=1 Tax=Rutidosis leptorrhynchoides TaxID=125765 RepID=UPI003A9912A9